MRVNSINLQKSELALNNTKIVIMSSDESIDSRSDVKQGKRGNGSNEDEARY
jgi:hypothetical protein